MNLTTKQATLNIFSRLSWKIYKPTLFSIVTFLSVFPCVLFLSEKYAWENSFIENFQLVVIAITFMVALRAKWAKKLFNWIAMITIMLFLREVNCGRVFFSKNCPNSFKGWNEILPYPYNFIPRIVFAIFIIYAVYYFFKAQVYVELWQIIAKAKIDCWNIFFMWLGIVVGTISEITINNMMLEETSETLFYISFAVLVYLYGQNKDFCIDRKKIPLM